MFPLPAGGPEASEVRPRERRRKRLASAAALVRAATSPRIIVWGDPKVQAPLFGSATIKGPAGCGKSTFATAVAIRIARDVGTPVLYISSEEGGEVSAVVRFARVARMMGIVVPEGLIISDAQDVHEADEDVAEYERGLDGRGGFIIVDSLSQLRAPQPWWEDLLNSGHGCLLVLHTVTTGEARGGREPEYAVSVNIVVDSDGDAMLMKNRWGRTGEETRFSARNPPWCGVMAPPPEDSSDDGGQIITFPGTKL